uniref:Mechanosensitive ion channel MscS domain-containing protein n=1 Tax=Arundo donax TaxID=35708 RepID=A0A0A8XY34_ARUDO
MLGIAAILRRSCRSAASQSLMETYVGPCVASGDLRWFNSCAKHSRKPDISVVYQIKAVDRYSTVNDVSKISRMPLSCRMDTNRLIASKSRYNALPGFLGISSFHRGYSSDTGIKPEASQSSVSNIPSSEGSEVGTVGDGGGSWIEILDNACKSTVDATTDAGKKVKELTDAITPHVQQLFDANPNLEKVVVPLGGTLFGTMMAWLVMPVILRRLHKYASQSPIATLLGNSTKNDVSYQTSLWCALEDPAKYLITFMAFSEMATLIAPSISTYLPQAWRGAFVLSFVWFLHRWKTNFIAKAMTNQDASSVNRDNISVFDKVSSLGLIGLGVMGLAEACGVAVQSILTVGGVGGVATAFAAKDVLGNMLSGFNLQFSKPFVAGDYIKAGSIEGKVTEIGLTSTSLINPEKLPVIVPNSLFSSQIIVNRSRANWRASVTKIPIRIEDIEKVPSISEDIKVMLRSNTNVSFESDVPYCYLSRLESSYGELTIGCNLKNMRKDEWLSAEQDILLGAARIIKSHGIELGSTMQCC